MTGLLTKLARAWRIAATGFCFTCFGLGALLQGLSVWPLLYLFSGSRDSGHSRVQRAVSASMRLFVWLMRSVGVLTYEIHGRRWLATRGQLVIANHPSLIDVVFLVSLMPEVVCIVKEALWRNPFLRWPVLWAGYISNVSNGERLIANCTATLRAGRSLLMFPEGTRTRPGERHHMQRGAAQIAIAARAPARTVLITCRPATLHKGDPWYNSPPARPHWVIRVSEHALELDPYMHESASLGARHLTSYLETMFDQQVPPPPR